MEAVIHEINEEDYHDDYSEAARMAFEAHPETDGVFCTSDRIASYVMQEALRRGKRVPEQVKVVGFNDCIATRCVIPLTSVRQPLAEMCAAAIDCVLCQIEGRPYQTTMCFPVTLSRRASTRGYSQEGL